MFDSRSYLAFDALLKEAALGVTPAELQASLCAKLTLQRATSVNDWLTTLFADEHIPDLQPTVEQALEALHELTGNQLRDEEFGFQLFLPDESEPLEARTTALTEWCSAYLSAWGTGHADTVPDLPAEAQEFIADLVEISQAGQQGSDDEEQDSFAFFEVAEYVRMGTLLLFESTRPPEPLVGESDHVDEPIH